MAEEIHSPLRDYRLIYRDRFIQAAEEAFQQFVDGVHIDVKANRKTCQDIGHYQQSLDSMGKHLRWWRILCIMLWIAAPSSLGLWLTGTTPIFIPLIIIISIILLEFLLIHRKISSLSKQRNEHRENKERLITKAYSQMEPLNSLYDNDIFRRLVNEVFPIIHIEPYLKASDMKILTDEMCFKWNDTSNSCVIGLQSGKINGNPFIINVRLIHYMSTKTYTGTKNVVVRATRTINGKKETYMTTQTLRASVTKPYPVYTYSTELIYGNHAAPDLIFSRKKNTFSKKEGSMSYKFTHWRLQREASKMDKDFALMTNDEFEVLFTTTDRNNNHQYTLLFTPIAQANIIELIRDNERTGYGDDFCFYKDGRINTIISEHLTEYNIYGTSHLLRQYEFDKAKENFISTNLETFRSLYFALAPLLSIPLYQQTRLEEAQNVSTNKENRSHRIQHEELAFLWGQTEFQHPQCVTQNILKTKEEYLPDGSTKGDVTAYGYRSEKRIDYQIVRASDGAFHTIEVKWDEYFPVTGNGRLYIKELEDQTETKLSPAQRQQRIKQILNSQKGTHLIRNIKTCLDPIKA